MMKCCSQVLRCVPSVLQPASPASVRQPPENGCALVWLCCGLRAEAVEAIAIEENWKAGICLISCSCIASWFTEATVEAGVSPSASPCRTTACLQKEAVHDHFLKSGRIRQQHSCVLS